MLEWILARFDGKTVKSGKQNIILPANTSTLIAELDFTNEVSENPAHKTYRKECYENRRHYYLSYQLIKNNKVLSSNIEVFVPYKYLSLEKPGLKYKIVKSEDSYNIEISTIKPALFIELGLKESYARFSDNYFHLFPEEKRIIKIVESEIPIKKIKKRFYVKSLVDIY
jgi:hypothetical protein